MVIEEARILCRELRENRRDFVTAYRHLGIVLLGLMGPGIVALPFAIGFLMVPERSPWLLPITGIVSALSIGSRRIYHPAYLHHFGPTFVRALPFSTIHRMTLHTVFELTSNRWLVAVFILTALVLTFSPDFEEQRSEALINLASYGFVTLAIGAMFSAKGSSWTILFFILHVAGGLAVLYGGVSAAALATSLAVAVTVAGGYQQRLPEERQNVFRPTLFQLFYFRQTALLPVACLGAFAAVSIAINDDPSLIVEIAAFAAALVAGDRVHMVTRAYRTAVEKTQHMPFSNKVSLRRFSSAGIASLVFAAAIIGALAGYHPHTAVLQSSALAILFAGSLAAVFAAHLRLAIVLPVVAFYYLWTYAS